MSTKATVKRTLVKTVSYRAVVVAANGAVVYAMTGKPDLAIGFSSITALIATAMYYANERLWERIDWGNQPVN